jgi:hypothetical protein
LDASRSSQSEYSLVILTPLASISGPAAGCFFSDNGNHFDRLEPMYGYE